LGRSLQLGWAPVTLLLLETAAAVLLALWATARLDLSDA
jgi:hypothetical protein